MMKTLGSTSLAIVATVVSLAGTHWGPVPSEKPSLSVIVQGSDARSAARAVRGVGGNVTHELGIIDAVAARVTARQARQLRRSRGVRLHADGQVSVAGVRVLPTYYPGLVGADTLHAQGITGAGVTVAVIDTGLWGGKDTDSWLVEDLSGKNRVLARYDAIRNAVYTTPADAFGHGTHVTSILASSASRDGAGIAPDVKLLPVTAFDSNGSGTYADVIRGLDYVVQKRATYNIRVVNLSFSAPARSHYWDDPLNQAVMKAWQAGIVVVVSAGNSGPDPMTVGVPGNVPYVITVGAMTDRFTPEDPLDDVLGSFSSTGPTTEGFVKPDLVAPGGHMRGLMNGSSTLSKFYDYLTGATDAIAIGPSTMEGDLKLSPGALLRVGYSFTVPGGHPAITVKLEDATVTFQAKCVQSANGTGGTIEIPVVGSPITVPKDNNAWFPTGDQNSLLSYQASVLVPDLCRGGQVTLKAGGTFTGTLLAGISGEPVNVRWHYSGNGSKGGWSSTKGFLTYHGSFFTMTGTSQSAAVVSGVAALLLQREPWLTPNDVKCRLMATARPAVDANGNRAYSVFQQGAGLVNAHEASHSTVAGCANQGLDVALDLAGAAHYGGLANRDADGNYYLMGLGGTTSDGYLWSGGYLWSNGYLWTDTYAWADAYLWSGGYLWSNGYLWSGAYLWSNGYLWTRGLTEATSTNKWVDQQ